MVYVLQQGLIGPWGEGRNPAIPANWKDPKDIRGSMFDSALVASSEWNLDYWSAGKDSDPVDRELCWNDQRYSDARDLLNLWVAVQPLRKTEAANTLTAPPHHPGPGPFMQADTEFGGINGDRRMVRTRFNSPIALTIGIHIGEQKMRHLRMPLSTIPRYGDWKRNNEGSLTSPNENNQA